MRADLLTRRRTAHLFNSSSSSAGTLNVTLDFIRKDFEKMDDHPPLSEKEILDHDRLMLQARQAALEAFVIEQCLQWRVAQSPELPVATGEESLEAIRGRLRERFQTIYDGVLDAAFLKLETIDPERAARIDLRPVFPPEDSV